MTLFGSGVEVFDVTVPFGPNVPAWLTYPPTVVEPLRHIAIGDGAPAPVLLVRHS